MAAVDGNCRHTRMRIVLPALLAAAASFSAPLAAASSVGQDSKPAPATPATDLGGYRLPLLREGSVIVRVEGDLAQDPDEKVWLFRPFVREAGGLRREFVVLASPVLEDMLRTARVAPAPVQFEVTGRVFIYRGRNFLLPELAPPIVRFDAQPGDTPPPAKPVTAPNGESKFVPPAGDSDDAAVAEIERRLEERVARAPAPRNAEPVTAAEPARKPAPIASGTRIAQRRGQLLRDPQAGSWRFVPAQATGAGDASLELLPCMLLETLERTARESDGAPDVVVTGTVLAFEGRSYLLPSSFRRAREGRGISR